MIQSNKKKLNIANGVETNQLLFSTNNLKNSNINLLFQINICVFVIMNTLQISKQSINIVLYISN